MSAAPAFRFTLESLVDLLRQSQPDPFLLQIGAMDGVRFDPLFPIVSAGGWHGLLVEPLPDLFERLVENHRGRAGLAFANVAVTEEAGTRSIHRVDPRAIAEGRTPEWAIGISSFFTDRNSLGGVLTSPEDFARVKPFVVRQEVRCVTLAELLAAHRIERIDLLQIDTEGYDYRILRQLDFARYRPAVIHLEHYLLPEDERKACFALLLARGYVVGCTHKDVLATTLLGA
jgi:FkbM family methyltransferase